MTQHTQTKLAHRYGRIFSADREALTIANVGRAADGDFSEANARRLVACWNACEGISTEQIEHGLHVELITVCCGKHETCSRMCVPRAQHFKAQRDELLECLKLARAYMRTAIQSDTYRADPTCQRIESAIAKHQPAGEGPAQETA